MDDFQCKLHHNLEAMDKSKAEKDVGVTIDENLSFEKHMTDKINKANSVFGCNQTIFSIFRQ